MQVRFVLKALLLGSALALVLSNAVEVQLHARDSWQVDVEPVMTQKAGRRVLEAVDQERPLSRTAHLEWRAH